jgi:hypothetical protein
MRLCGIALVLLVGVAAPGLAQNRPTGLLVPAYFYPAGGAKDARWQQLADAARAGVPMTVIVNPASGPGKVTDPNYTAVIDRVQKAGVTTVGYVTTSYARRPAADVLADVKTWLKLYPTTQGIFLDEQPSGAAEVAAYIELCESIRRLNPKLKILSNPGTVCDAGYFGTGGPDVVCVHENEGSFRKYAPPAKAYPPGRTAGLVHTTPKGAGPAAEVALARGHGFGMVFVTDALMPNPWDRLPTYWDDLLTAVAPPTAGGMKN